jgi:membrane protease YdiL (CAAX protease family)
MAPRTQTWLLMITAPVAVIMSLGLLRSVWAVFAIYHLGICLLGTWLLGRGGEVPLPVRLGMVSEPRCGAESRRKLLLGLATGLGGGGLLLLANALLGGRYLEAERVAGAMADWGVRPAQVPLAAAFMVLVNGPAEEVFWRGYVQHRLGPLERPFPALAVPSLWYASYHAVTVLLFLNSALMAAGILAGIFLSGCGWAWLRWRTGSLWPSLISHQLLTVAYVAIWLKLS